MWLQWLVLDRCFGLALLLCTHSMHLQRAGMISRRAAMLSPLSHTCRRLPQALAAQRVHGQMADPNSRAASAQCSRSMESASMVRVDFTVPSCNTSHHGTTPPRRRTLSCRITCRTVRPRLDLYHITVDESVRPCPQSEQGSLAGLWAPLPLLDCTCLHGLHACLLQYTVTRHAMPTVWTIPAGHAYDTNGGACAAHESA